MKVLIDGENVEVVIIKKNIKNTYIRVKDDLKVYVTTNMLTSNLYITNLVNDNIGYITKMYNIMLKKCEKAKKFYYLGKEYKVVILNTIKNPKIVEDYIYVKQEDDLDKFLKKMSKSFLVERVSIVYNKMNNKSIMDMARQLGLPVTEANIEDVSSMSQQQMEAEIRKLKNEIKKDPETFRKQVAAIKSLSSMMNPMQRAKLESLLRMLEE